MYLLNLSDFLHFRIEWQYKFILLHVAPPRALVCPDLYILRRFLGSPFNCGEPTPQLIINIPSNYVLYVLLSENNSFIVTSLKMDRGLINAVHQTLDVYRSIGIERDELLNVFNCGFSNATPQRLFKPELRTVKYGLVGMTSLRSHMRSKLQDVQLTLIRGRLTVAWWLRRVGAY